MSGIRTNEIRVFYSSPSDSSSPGPDGFRRCHRPSVNVLRNKWPIADTNEPFAVPRRFEQRTQRGTTVVQTCLLETFHSCFIDRFAVKTVFFSIVQNDRCRRIVAACINGFRFLVAWWEGDLRGQDLFPKKFRMFYRRFLLLFFYLGTLLPVVGRRVRYGQTVLNVFGTVKTVPTARARRAACTVPGPEQVRYTFIMHANLCESGGRFFSGKTQFSQHRLSGWKTISPPCGVNVSARSASWVRHVSLIDRNRTVICETSVKKKHS